MLYVIRFVENKKKALKKIKENKKRKGLRKDDWLYKYAGVYFDAIM